MKANVELSRRKLWFLSLFAVVIGIVSTFVAQILLKGISLFTNLFWFQKFSLKDFFAKPFDLEIMISEIEKFLNLANS